MLSTKTSENYNYDKNKLIAKQDRQFLNTVDNKTKKIWFWLGFIEILPPAIGLVFSIAMNKILFQFDYLVIGIVIMMLVILLLNRKIPKAPIGLKK